MVSFVIYEKNKNNREVYTKLIKKFLYNSLDHYKIYEFDRYNLDVEKEMKNIKGAKIYILNIDGNMGNGCDIAKRIRHDGDFISPIILLTENKNKLTLDKLGNILYLDVLNIDKDLITSLMQCLREAHRMVTRFAVYTFSVFDEIYRIPHDDIYYIEKNLHDDSVTIYTKDDTYLNYISLKGIGEALADDPRFFRSHRSCILNIYNILSYDKKSRKIVFNNGMQINLISKYKKAELDRRLKDFDNKEIAGK